MTTMSEPDMSTTILTDEQKNRFVSEICEYGTGFVAPLYSVVEAIEQAVLQSPEIQALRKDAERYRHLRDQGELGPHDVFNAWWLSENGYPQTLDAAIDAAMEGQL